MTRKNDGCEEMVFVNTNKSILCPDGKTNSSSVQIESDENMNIDGYNLQDEDLDDSLEIETICE